LDGAGAAFEFERIQLSTSYQYEFSLSDNTQKCLQEKPDHRRKNRLRYKWGSILRSVSHKGSSDRSLDLPTKPPRRKHTSRHIRRKDINTINFRLLKFSTTAPAITTTERLSRS
jgi:hypothetical protein